MTGDSGSLEQAACARAARLAGILAELELDALLVDVARSILRYLSGFTGSHGIALMGAGGGRWKRLHRFLTDFRYATQSAEQVPDCFEREIVYGSCSTSPLPWRVGAGASVSREAGSQRQGAQASAASCWGRDGSWFPAPAPSSGCA